MISQKHAGNNPQLNFNLPQGKLFTAEQLSKITGIHMKELEMFLGNLLKENKIKREGNLFIGMID